MCVNRDQGVGCSQILSKAAQNDQLFQQGWLASPLLLHRTRIYIHLGKMYRLYSVFQQGSSRAPAVFPELALCRATMASPSLGYDIVRTDRRRGGFSGCVNFSCWKRYIHTALSYFKSREGGLDQTGFHEVYRVIGESG